VPLGEARLGHTLRRGPPLKDTSLILYPRYTRPITPAGASWQSPHLASTLRRNRESSFLR
jgi:hypothetical protein